MALRRIRIWDLPTRIFHWLLVLLIGFQWWTAEEDRLDLHILGGMAILALLLFRILWGLFGSSTARFVGFVKGPRGISRYLSGHLPPAVGHNPVGAISVIAMIGLLSIEVGLGLFATDGDGLGSGPLSHLIDSDLSDTLTEWHEDAFDVLLVLIGLHLAAILFYLLVRRKNLVTSMISGRGIESEGVGEMESAPVWRLLLAILATAAVVLWVNSGVPL